VVEIFFFEEPAEASEARATARGQLDDPSAGEASAGTQDEDVSDEIQAD
jgi:hypothetical protein